MGFSLEGEDAPIDIAADPQARARVLEINDGYEGVPTMEFPDGSALTAPATGE